MVTQEIFRRRFVDRASFEAIRGEIEPQNVAFRKSWLRVVRRITRRARS